MKDSKTIHPGLVLSLFPGLDLLGRAFEAAGWCVVRGPDVLFAGDVCEFHPTPGRFDGVIGGPPCQAFSQLVHLVRANGHEPKFGNLIPEFERCVTEARPVWWLMEEVPGAPVPRVGGYRAESLLLSPRDLGNAQSRTRRLTVGVLEGLPRIDLGARLPLLVPESAKRVNAATGGGSKYENRPGRRGISAPGRTWQLAAEIAETQGFPGLSEQLREAGIWTAAGVCQSPGNGVPRVMGEALAAAVTEWWRENVKP